MAAAAQLILVDEPNTRDQIGGELERFGLKLTKLCQLDNKLLKIKFEQELNNLKLTKPEGFDGNIMRLYHGTPANLDQICEEGLDERLSRKGRFGRGIYFSDDPTKCCKYAEKKNNESNYLLICRVILGDIKEYQDGVEDRNLTKEPLKENINGKRIFYDSVKGKPCHHMEYVIYEKRRMLIEYVAYYEKVNSVSTQHSTSSSLSESESQSGSNSEEDECCIKKRQVKENLKKEQRAALQQLAQMKPLLRKQDFDELAQSFISTYGPTEDLDKMISETGNGSNRNKTSQDTLKQFSAITNCTDLSTCEIYLANNSYVLQDALNSYYDCHN